jgi:hypothetical protein
MRIQISNAIKKKCVPVTYGFAEGHRTVKAVNTGDKDSHQYKNIILGIYRQHINSILTPVNRILFSINDPETSYKLIGSTFNLRHKITMF